MTSVILYGLGSPVIVDVEESLDRLGLDVAAAVCNHPGAIFFTGTIPPTAPVTIDDRLRSLPYVVPLFTPGHRQSAADEAERFGLREAHILVDPTAVRPRRLELGRGCYINAGCSLGACGTLGRFVFVNRGATLGHHAKIGDYVSIGPGAVLAGHVTMEQGSVVGAGATILPEVTIGANAVVGAGAVATKDVPAQCLVLGNPGRVVREGIGGYHGRQVT